LVVADRAMQVVRKWLVSVLVVIYLCAINVFSAAGSDTQTEHSLVGLMNSNELNTFEENHAEILYVDTRQKDICLHESIRDSLCLSPQQLQYPNGTLASFRDINWLAGTYGISSDSAVVVIGDDAANKYMVAAVLHLLGVREIAVWKPVFESIASEKKVGRGRGGGILRSVYFTNQMRDDQIALDSDLRHMFSSDKHASIEKLNTFELNGYLLHAPNQSSIVTGTTPSAALANFTSQAMKNQNTELRVHTNGLGSRSLDDFGYVRPYRSFVVGSVSLVVLSIVIYGIRRHWS